MRCGLVGWVCCGEEGGGRCARSSLGAVSARMRLCGEDR